MQSAVASLQSVPGVNLTQLQATPAGGNAQQAYTDTMTAMAMQQAAAAQMMGAQHFLSAAMNSNAAFIANPMGTWATDAKAEEAKKDAAAEEETKEEEKQEV